MECDHEGTRLIIFQIRCKDIAFLVSILYYK